MTKLKTNHLPLIALCFGFFMVIMDVTIVNVALPSMAKSLSGGVSWLQWVVDGYTLTFACLLLSTGSLADRFGAKTAFLSGLILFVLTSVGCGLANSFLFLTLFRLLQGVGAALLVPTSLALINAVYTTKPERAYAIGIWAAIGGIAAGAGPIIGGVLTFWLGWRAVFFVNVPIGIVGFLLALRYVPNPSSSQKGSFDFMGQLLGIISIAALAFSLIEAGRLGWYSHAVLAGFGIFLVTFIAFLLTERRVAMPMLPLNLFNSATFCVAILVAALMTFNIYGEFFVLTLYFQQIKNYSPLLTGFAFIPFVGVAAIASYFGGKMTSLMGPRLPMIIGLTIGMVGFLSMLIAGEHSSYGLLIIPLLSMGLGISLPMPAVTAAAIHSAPDERAGISAGALNTSRQIGSLMGVAIFGTILNTSSHFMQGMHITLIIGAVAFLIGCVATFVYVK